MGGYQEKGEKSVAPTMSATAPVNPPATGPKRRLASKMGMLPKLMRALWVSQITINRDNIMLIAAKSAMSIRVLVLNFFIKKSSYS